MASSAVTSVLCLRDAAGNYAETRSGAYLLSDLDFWKIHVPENVRNAANTLPESSRPTTTASVLSIHDLLPSLTL